MRSPQPFINPILTPLLRFVNTVEVLAIFLLLAFEVGLGDHSPHSHQLIFIGDSTVVVSFFIRLLYQLFFSPHLVKRPGTLLAMALGLLLFFFSLRLTAGVFLLHDIVSAWFWLRQRNPFFQTIRLHPARSMVVSFLSIIAVGTLLLWMPSASAAGSHVPLLDAFFIAVSAACVTGLATVDTATTWSPFGKSIIFCLFQLGGLGVMVISASMTVALGQRLSIRHGATLQALFDEGDAEQLKRLLKTIIMGTLAIECVGALLLFPVYYQSMPFWQAVGYALFHSVSAFCNAGFSLSSGSLTAFVSSPWVNGVVSLLVITGGIGFGVLISLYTLWRSRQKWRLSVHDKIVLYSSALLLWLGTLLYFFLEFDRSLALLSTGDKLMAAFFQSMSTRTAGFNTVPLEQLGPATVVVMVGLMLIGASPGSTGGGIKTTTVAVVLLAARAYLLQKPQVEIFGRRIPERQVLRAVALLGGALVGLVVAFVFLLHNETQPFEQLLFEVVSALGTVGLSMGITADLTMSGKLTLCLLMFLGRVGPLTAIAAFTRYRQTQPNVVLPEGKILVG